MRQLPPVVFVGIKNFLTSILGKSNSLQRKTDTGLDKSDELKICS